MGHERNIKPSDTESAPFGATDPTDGRKLLEWESRYPSDAISKIRIEAIILILMFTLSLVFIFLLWCSTASYWHSKIPDYKLFQHYGYFAFSGLLGGTIFSVKWLYHAVARGIWNEDRKLWRTLTPLMSFGIGFIVGALVHAGYSNTTAISGASSVLIGFLAGYFSDNAIAKMYEVANVFFGTAQNKPTGKS